MIRTNLLSAVPSYSSCCSEATADLLCVPLQPTVWPGEPVLMMLDDLEFQWKRGRLPTLLPAMELVMLAVLNADSPAKVWMKPSGHRRAPSLNFQRH